jgi:hypothetical protein
LLLLTEEEASQLADAVNQFHVPRSLLILEAIQAGLRSLGTTTIPGRRSKPLSFRLPDEIAVRVKQVAQEHHVSQQNLIRHLLFNYLTQLAAETPNTTETRPTNAIRAKDTEERIEIAS